MKSIWPFRHVGLKVWSVILAAMLWFVVAGQETVERGLRVPLELQQFPTDLELQDDAPSLVDVRIRGASSALSRLGPGDVVALLDLRSARPGRRLFQLTPEQVRAPFGIQVVQVLPPNITLMFETSAMKSVPIVPSIEGSPAPGFVVGKVTTDPPTIEVVGPSSAVERTTEALTEAVSVAGAQRDVSETVTVGLVDQSLRIRTPKPVNVTVHVVPAPVERVVSDLPVRLRNIEPGLRAQVMPNAVDVVLRGTAQGVSLVNASSVTAFVDLSGLTAGEYTLGVQVDAAQDAGVARIMPASVQVKIGNAK